MFGGRGADFITGNLGDDALNGNGGRDRIFGGRGQDTINGGPGVSSSQKQGQAQGKGPLRRPPARRRRQRHVNGNNGRDLISGGRGDDTSTGGDGNDLIFANLGADKSFGGDGNDVLWALARGDVAAPGDPIGDELTGGNGNDRFRVRDGEVDRINCGDGNDTVHADQYDVIVDATPANQNGSCERVMRNSTPDSDSEESKTQSPKEDGKETLGRARVRHCRSRRAPVGHRGPSAF